MSACWVIYIVSSLLHASLGHIQGGNAPEAYPEIEVYVWAACLFFAGVFVWLFIRRLKSRHLQEKQQMAAERRDLQLKVDSLTLKNHEISQLLIERMKEMDTWNRHKEEKHQQAVRTLEEKEKRHNFFFKEVIHEMRTPLSLILASISEIVRKNTLHGEVSAQLLSAYRNALALQDLSLQLRSARLGEDVADHLRVARYDMIEITRQICDLFVDWIAMNNVDFRINTQLPVLWVWCDRRKLEFALRLLLTNAMKNTFMYGRIVIDLSIVEADDGKKQGCFSILDEGLDETDNTRQGLSQIAHMARTAGMTFSKGDVSAKGGCCYLLLIPLGKHYLMERPVEFVEPDGNLLTFNTQQKEEMAELIRVIPPQLATGKKLLVIDDSDQIRWFLKHVFQKEYTILEARNGEEGVKRARREQPDVVLCDVMMPLKDGLAVCRELKSDPVTSHIAFIMLTAKIESEDIIAGIEAGVDDYITKPFDVAVLRSKIISVLKRREEMKRYHSRILAEPGFPPGSSAVSPDPADPTGGKEASGEEESPTAATLFMDAVVKTIEKHIGDPGFEAKVLADSLHMSLPTLYRKIKLYSAYSVLEITRMVRLKKAAELIAQQRYTIQEVSEKVGFNDPATFRKRFTEQYGVTPSGYLASLGKQG